MSDGKEMVDLFASLIQDQRILAILLNTPQFPWIPGPGGLNLKGGLGSWTGVRSSPLGILFSTSLLPNTNNFKIDKSKQESTIYLNYFLHNCIIFINSLHKSVD